ncbi:Protein disulfide-isomerase 1 [Smittium culicis]|uniref:protein disulfide-isomerase n=1 Tax=Smittium culicis TaxID=133412 RepID=A0A1R1X729_9FUNG|nr:Protein disulfide-isomerase 1 [Smittium culicis]OMJ17148.1 Protein disulfide-isomerase 1 [Smittium culicis]
MFGVIKLSTVSILLALASNTIIASDAEHSVRSLTAKDFDAAIEGAKKGSLIKFFAPWCGHCKNMANDYIVLSSGFKDQSDVLVAEVNCDDEKDLCSRFDIKGYPTLKWFNGNVKSIDSYSGGRDENSLKTFILDKTGIEAKKEAVVDHVTDLTPDSFDPYVIESKKNFLVDFYASWCGFCKRLEPVYRKLANIYLDEAEIVGIGKIDAAENLAIGSKYQVTKYPTLMMFKENDKANPVVFEGEPTLEKMVTFINGITGTKVTADGGLDDSYGRAEALDFIASEFVAASDEKKTELMATAKTMADKLAEDGNKAASFYPKLMARIIKDSKYLDTEITRLSSITNPPNQSSKKNYQSAKARLNILKVFAGKADSLSEIASKLEESLKSLSGKLPDLTAADPKEEL